MSKKLIYQVYVGPKSKLYDTCTKSVRDYAKKIGAEYILLKEPKLKINPNPFASNRSDGASRLGYLPIYEKENAFDYVCDYDQIAIIDSDVWIRPNDEPVDIFKSINPKAAIAATLEHTMPLTNQYVQKIKNYSKMQYANLFPEEMRISKGYPFANMGVMVINCEVFWPYLRGESAKEFLSRYEFQDFINGKGAWKWSTDQTMLNWWIWKYQIPFQNLDWRFNGLFTANTSIHECHFVHFFLRDKLPGKGENIDELLEKL